MSDELRGGEGGQPSSNPLKKERKQGKKGANRILVLAIAGLCVVVAVGVYLLATRVFVPEAPEYTLPPDKSIALASKTRDDVESVTITKGSSTLTVLKEDGVYYAKEYPDLRLNQSDASSLFYNAAAARADALVEENAQDLAMYGLDNPASTAVARYTDGTTATFYVGNATAAGTTYYLMREGDPNVYIVWTNIAAAFGYDITALREVVMPELDAANIAHVLLEREGEEPIELTFDNTKGYTINTWHFVRPFDDVAGDYEAMQTLIEAMVGVEYTSLLGRFDDLSEYGLDKPRAHFAITDNDGQVIDLNVGGQSPDGYYTYVSPPGTGDVYRVLKAKLAFVDSTSVMKLVDMFANIINITRVDKLELNGSGEKAVVTVARTAKLDENGEVKTLTNGDIQYDEVYSLDGAAVNTKATKALYTAVIGLRIDGRLREDFVPQGEPVLTADFTLNVAPHTIKVEYLPYDKDNYAVRLNGVSHFYLRKENVDDIFVTLRQYRAGELDAEE